MSHINFNIRTMSNYDSRDYSLTMNYLGHFCQQSYIQSKTPINATSYFVFSQNACSVRWQQINDLRLQ